MSHLPPTFALEPALRKQFADSLLAGYTPYVAALRLWPGNPGLAAQVSKVWPDDPYVVGLMEQARQAEAALAAETPKERQIRRIEQKLPTFRAEEYLKAERLLAELAGHLTKPEAPSVTVNNNNTAVDRVMIVSDFGSDEAWEKRVALQQRQLIEHNG